MNLFDVLKKIYTAKDLKWTQENDIDEHPVIVLKWLAMNSKLQKHCRFLNQYVFILSPQMFVALAWATIPRHSSVPFIKYIKSKSEEEMYIEVWDKIQRIGKYSDNDMPYIKKYLNIESDIETWFQKLGFDKKMYAKYGLNYEQSKGEIIKGKSGLDLFM